MEKENKTVLFVCKCLYVIFFASICYFSYWMWDIGFYEPECTGPAFLLLGYILFAIIATRVIEMLHE